MPLRGTTTRRRRSASVRQQTGIQLDVGCGFSKRTGYVGLDRRDVPGVDIVHDIEVTPWPLDADSVLLSVMSHVWEHITPSRTLDVMAELHRIGKHDSLVMMTGPYSNGFRFVQDPTHCNPSNEATFRYWDPFDASQLWQVYQPPVLHLVAFEILPANGDRDFEVALRICKRFKNGRCPHGG